MTEMPPAIPPRRGSLEPRSLRLSWDPKAGPAAQMVAAEVGYRKCRSLTPPERLFQANDREGKNIESPLVEHQRPPTQREPVTTPPTLVSPSKVSVPISKKQCELIPGHCHVYESVELLIDLSSSNGCYLTERQCKVIFHGERSGRHVAVDGFKRNHDYGIRTRTPVWYEGERLAVTVETGCGVILAIGRFEVISMANWHNLPLAILACVSLEDPCSVSFVNNVLGAFLPNTEALMVPRPLSSTYSFVMCCPESPAAVTELFERTLEFSMINGVPPGLSLFDMFSGLPHLRRRLESSSYAKGSLSELLSAVRAQSKHQDVVYQIEALVRKAGSTSTDPYLGKEFQSTYEEPRIQLQTAVEDPKNRNNKTSGALSGCLNPSIQSGAITYADCSIDESNNTDINDGYVQMYRSDSAGQKKTNTQNTQTRFNETGHALPSPDSIGVEEPLYTVVNPPHRWSTSGVRDSSRNHSTSRRSFTTHTQYRTESTDKDGYIQVDSPEHTQMRSSSYSAGDTLELPNTQRKLRSQNGTKDQLPQFLVPRKP